MQGYFDFCADYDHILCAFSKEGDADLSPHCFHKLQFIFLSCNNKAFDGVLEVNCTRWY